MLVIFVVLLLIYAGLLFKNWYNLKNIIFYSKVSDDK